MPPFGYFLHFAGEAAQPFALCRGQTEASAKAELQALVESEAARTGGCVTAVVVGSDGSGQSFKVSAG